MALLVTKQKHKTIFLAKVDIMKHEVEVKIHKQNDFKYWFCIVIKNTRISSETRGTKSYRTRKTATNSAWNYYHKIFSNTGSQNDD